MRVWAMLKECRIIQNIACISISASPQRPRKFPLIHLPYRLKQGVLFVAYPVSPRASVQRGHRSVLPEPPALILGQPRFKAPYPTSFPEVCFSLKDGRPVRIGPAGPPNPTIRGDCTVRSNKTVIPIRKAAQVETQSGLARESEFARFNSLRIRTCQRLDMVKAIAGVGFCCDESDADDESISGTFAALHELIDEACETASEMAGADYNVLREKILLPLERASAISDGASNLLRSETPSPIPGLFHAVLGLTDQAEKHLSEMTSQIQDDLALAA